MSKYIFMGEVSVDNKIKRNWAAEAVFSKRVFIYSESELTPEQLKSLEDFSDAKGISIRFRSAGLCKKLR